MTPDRFCGNVRRDFLQGLRVAITDFDDIRPYNDNEVRPVLERNLNNREFIGAVTSLRFPRAASVFGFVLQPLVRAVLRHQFGKVADVRDFQMIVERYVTRMIASTTTQFTVSGLEHLDPSQPYLFVSNHRDITLDPALVNYSLHHAGHDTVRIAIGDNLLTKDYASDLMRLNKTFIVKRSAKGPRELLASLRKLSAYIRHSITVDRHSVWIAQREGRAKDGIDQTEPAILKMFALSAAKGTSVGAALAELKMVPVSISYEYDPCDLMKARELYTIASTGSYQKGPQEDITSIAAGITGTKGDVHLAYGKPLSVLPDDVDDVAALFDREIVTNYVLHPSNYFAYHALHGAYPRGVYGEKRAPFEVSQLESHRAEFAARLENCPPEHRPYFLANYANAIVSKQKLGLM